MIMQILISITAFGIAITFLVTVHELGHFIMARIFHVKVLKFSIGFGKPLWTWRSQSGTDYMISAIPIGGYVKMLGEDEKVTDEADLKFAYNRQSVLKRMAIIIAGPLSNILFALIVLWLANMIGIKALMPVIGTVYANSPASLAGLRSNQQILMVDNHPTPGWRQVENYFIQRLGSLGNIIIQAKDIHTNQITLHDLPIATWHQADFTQLELLDVVGMRPRLPAMPPVVARIKLGGRAEQAGLKSQDRILAVNGKKIQDFNELLLTVEENPEKPIRLLLDRNGQKLTTTVTPALMQLSPSHHIGYIGVYSKKVDWPKDWLTVKRYGPLAALLPTVQQVTFMTTVSIDLLWKMVTGKLSLRYVGGPIAIAKGAGKTAQFGLISFLNFLALVSIGLAIINLMPIPVLDGGYLVYYLYEVVMRRPIPEKIQTIGIRLGLIFLLGLMSLAFFNDIMQLWKH